MFFRLLNHCRLVEGACRAAIYDLNSGRVLSVNSSAADLLVACQSRAVEDILADLPDAALFQSFLNMLAEKQLGSFYVVEPAARPADFPVPSPVLDFLWLELTAKCNNRCLHCYSESDIHSEETAVPHARWLELLCEARAEGATGVQLIGGEPLLYSSWQELVEKAAALQYQYIEIFTNATLIREEDIDFFKRHHVHVATTIYAAHAAVHDSVTKNPGSFERTLSAVKRMLAAGVPVRIASIIMKVNEAEAENILRLCQQLGVDPQPPDVIRPTGRGDDDSLLPENYRRLPVRPPFAVDPGDFFQAQCINPCLAGKIAVTANGDVFPCIFARSMVCGNILQTPLRDVIRGAALQTCWHTTKDCVEKCRDCEYRYACHDCRPLAQGADAEKNWLAASPGCSYNPYIGRWEDQDE